ncbi:Glutaminase superfamily [Synechococcus sp. PCC 7335]|uniref:glutaminase A n=1 Tax=Synechococcus sp. (strain ATCC 29403 / PCC 7335) TaxID=91464 RepID=UPI00017ECE5E|nr:glutaminase A [Synechococcus sp. PCC 7335]EDX87669.1 Glutaminase superfamily [Synechococcus sp. PCC 7335]
MTLLQHFLDELYERYRTLSDGTIASYIPELTKADPNWFGISVVTVDGQIFGAGDVQQKFTIQSVSKVFAFGLALESQGRDAVLEKVGVEPTGDPFNSLIRLDEDSKRPFNPMINAGAIATTSLIKGGGPTSKLNNLLNMFENYLGHEVFIDMPTFMSERSTGHRNRAMAHLMLHFDMISHDIDAALDLYFQQCSVMVTCQDLAMMAATLANKGKQPLTQKQAVNPDYVRDILSVMYTCGMYNRAGEWAYRVGIPAKSGVSGGILAVVPGKAGIATFSPPIDKNGNSVRGLRVFEELSHKYGLHLFDLSMGRCVFSEAVETTHES